jgi:hypothetical protein
MKSSVLEDVETEVSDSIAGDRRAARRYDICLGLRWRLLRRRRVLDAGEGLTINLSSSGILFETEHPLPTGGVLELSIAWPVLLHNLKPLRLIVTGPVVRMAGCRVAIRKLQHELRPEGGANSLVGVPFAERR